MESLGILGVHSAHFAVRSLERARGMFEKQLGFQPLFKAGAELVKRTGQDSVVYGAGQARFAVSEPKNETCRGARYLRHHPEGVMSLSFAVRDAHFADAERPPTTLSGGETFLVSLALALALADYRAVEMPIETLLLDEGFGTLDTDTLNTAMDALERLQARGTQIGIISHLGGLRERIEARIVVGKVGNGRSEIRFELGVDV